MGVTQWVLAAVAAVVGSWVASVVVRGVRDGLRNARLDDLSALDYTATRPEAGVWRLVPPEGGDHWELWAPGTAKDERGFLVGRPAATFDAVAGPGRDYGQQRLPQIEPWARPWIERVSGRRVLEMHEGWSEPYGDHGRWRERVVFAIVENAHGLKIEVRPSRQEEVNR